jgi:hypothetical protein
MTPWRSRSPPHLPHFAPLAAASVDDRLTPYSQGRAMLLVPQCSMDDQSTSDMIEY